MPGPLSSRSALPRTPFSTFTLRRARGGRLWRTVRFLFSLSFPLPARTDESNPPNTACASQSITFATAYDSLGEEGLQHSINEPSCYGIFTNAGLLGTLSSVVSSTPSLKVIVYDGAASDIPKGALEELQKVHEGQPALEIYTFDEFLKLGKENPAKPNHPQPEDVATLMYTSGSTGAPKGVQITNANIVACLGAVQTLIPHVVKKGETYIAYLVRPFPFFPSSLPS
jgi:long-subunit acyl-CoA synthetase (AMP-forming)